MFANFCAADPFGILRGSVSRTGTVEIVAVAESELPTRGDFALVREGRAEGGRLLVLRITSAELGGPFGERSERGEEYLANFGRYGDGQRAVPVRIRELAVRYRLQALPLGWLSEVNGRVVFEPGFRELGLFGEQVYLPTPEALQTLVNLGLEHEDPDAIVRLGAYARGHEATGTAVNFSINRLKGKRTFVFARAGYGKSNLTKLLLSRLYASKPDVGLLIIDPDGEYAFDQRSETGATIQGFANHPDLAGRVTVFTGRDFELKRGRPNVHPLALDLRDVSPEAFVTLFVGEEKLNQVWVNRVRALGSQPQVWKELIDLLAAKRFKATDGQLAAVLAVDVQAGTDESGRKGADASLSALRNNIVPIIDRLHRPGSKMLGLTRAALLGRDDVEPGVVILDVSVLAAADADLVVRALLGRVFGDAVQGFTQTDRKATGALLVLEEAQTVLGGHRLDDRDIYVRWVKEGRKFGLGSMMITQQPGALSTELISQGDNFFAMHLLNSNDLSALGAANGHFSPDVLDYLRTEPVKGNCYFWSAPMQPYVVPVRVDSYERGLPRAHSESTPTGQSAIPRGATAPPSTARRAPQSTLARGPDQVAAAAAPALDARLDAVHEAVIDALLTSSYVHHFAVESVDGLPVTGTSAVALSFLSSQAYRRVAPQVLRSGDTINDESYDRLTNELVVDSLRRAELLAEAGPVGTSVIRTKTRSMVLLRAERVAALAVKRKVARPVPRETVVVTTR